MKTQTKFTDSTKKVEKQVRRSNDKRKDLALKLLRQLKKGYFS
ncbi:MAG: hypothetical protein ACRDBG_17280 [Waterburya sp.]